MEETPAGQYGTRRQNVADEHTYRLVCPAFKHHQCPDRSGLRSCYYAKQGDTGAIYTGRLDAKNIPCLHANPQSNNRLHKGSRILFPLREGSKSSRLRFYPCRKGRPRPGGADQTVETGARTTPISLSRSKRSLNYDMFASRVSYAVISACGGVSWG